METLATGKGIRGREVLKEDSMRDISARGRQKRADTEIVIPIVTEELSIGTQEIDAGGVRVSTHVTETPVERVVTIREERIEIERRRVDRPVEESDQAFRGRSIEMTGSTEEPIVTKRARIVEEIRIHKNVTERVEKIHDTLRHTDVKVSKVAGGPSFQAESYRDHFKRVYEAQHYPFEWVTPAYEYGERLRRTSGNDWTKTVTPARAAWEQKNPGTWDNYLPAVRYAWERAGQH